MNKDAEFNLKFNTNLEQTLKKSNTEAKTMVDKLEQFSKNFDRAEKKAGILNKTLSGVGKTMVEIGKVFIAGAALLGISELVRNVFDLDTAARQTAKTMGALGYNFQKTKDSVYALSIATGESAMNTMEIYQNLANLRVSSKDVNALTEDVINFSRATTMGQEATANLAGSLVTVGKLSKSQTEDVMNSMLQSQKAFGLTKGQLEGMSDTIVRSTQLLQQLGRSAGQVAQFTTGISKLSSAFASVGVSAETANKFVGDLLDPDKIIDNAQLYARLGISIQDAFTGNVNMDNSIDKFKELGQQMKQMNPAAAAAYAKSLGMSVGDLKAMADIDMTKYNKALANGASSAIAMKEASNQNLSPQEKITQTWQRIQSTVMSLIDKFMPFIELIVNALTPAVAQLTAWFNNNINNGVVKNFVGGVMKFIEAIPKILGEIGKFLTPAGIAALGVGLLLLFLKAKKAFSKNIEEGVSEGIQAGFKKAEVTKEMSKGAGQAVASSYQDALKGTTGNLIRSSQAEYLAQVAQLNGIGLTRALAQSGSNAKSKSSMFTRGGIVGSISGASENMGVGASNRRAQVAQDAMIRFKAEEENSNRLRELESKLAKDLESSQDQKEKNAIIRELNAVNRQIKGIDGLKAVAENRDNAYFDSLTAKQRLNMLNQAKEENQLSEKRSLAIQEQIDREADMASIRRKELEKLNKLELSYEESLLKIKLRDEEKEASVRFENLNKELQKEQEIIDKVRQGTSKLTRGGRTQESIESDAVSPRTFRKTLTDFGHQLTNSVGSKFASIGNRFENAVQQVSKSMKANASKVAGNIGKFAGKIALFSIPMMLLGAIMQKLQPVINVVMEIFGKLADALLPPLLNILQALLKVLLPIAKMLLPPLLSILGNLIGAIGVLVGVFNKDLGKGLIDMGDSFKDIADQISATGKYAGQKSIIDEDAINAAFEVAKKNNPDEEKTGSGSPIEKETSLANSPVVLQATGNGVRQMNMVDAQTKSQQKIAENTKTSVGLQQQQLAATRNLADIQKDAAIAAERDAALRAKIKAGEVFGSNDIAKFGLKLDQKTGDITYNGIRVEQAKAGDGKGQWVLN